MTYPPPIGVITPAGYRAYHEKKRGRGGVAGVRGELADPVVQALAAHLQPPGHLADGVALFGHQLDRPGLELIGVSSSLITRRGSFRATLWPIRAHQVWGRSVCSG